MIVRTYDVFCDGRDDIGPCPQWATEASSGVSGTDARMRAKAEGWVRRNGKDLCPDCARKEQP